MGREQPAACREPKRKHSLAGTEWNQDSQQGSAPASQRWDPGGWGDILGPPSQRHRAEWEQR